MFCLKKEWDDHVNCMEYKTIVEMITLGDNLLKRNRQFAYIGS
jgi:hypothetical protein